MLSKGDIFRNYRVEKILQSVGMVHTYLVIHEKDQQKYVLKVLQERFRNVPQIQKSFIGEYRLAQKVQHENLVFIDQVFVKESAVLLEHLQGVTLEEQLRISEKIEPFTALQWAAQVLQALNILHQHRMVHLEVNPANIFLVPAENGLKKAILMDHGIGYRVHQGPVKPTFPEHSVYYISPELISNPISTKFRSDIYSLGVVLFEMMSGKRMIAGENEYAVQNAIVEGERQGLKESAPHVPTSIAMVIEQALQLNPVSRYPTVTAFLDALVRAVGGPLIEEDTQKSPEHDDFDFLLDESEEEDSALVEDASDDGGKRRFSKGQHSAKRQHSASENNNSSQKGSSQKGSSQKGSSQKGSQDNTSDSLGEDNEAKQDKIQNPKSEHEVVVDNIEHVDAEVIEDSSAYDIDGNVIILEHSADAWTEAKMIPPKEGGLRLVISPKVLWGVAILFLLSFIFGGVEARSRLVRITIEDKPQWGELSFLWDREKVENLEFEDLSPGDYSLLISGGIFEGDTCTRCCWERRFEFSISMGFTVENRTISLSEEERGYPRCPTLEENYEFVSVEIGRFKMGSAIEDEDRTEDEIQHYVDISQPFLMGKTEVTQGLYQAVTDLNPARYKGRYHPIETVSWFEAVGFCNELSIMEGLTPCYEVEANFVGWKSGLSCTGYRLPTEAEWEYAARGGKTSTYAHGDEVDGMWYGKNSRAQTQEVMKKSSNPLGLFDMSGNVSEWVWDYYGDYSIQNYRDPKGPNEGRYRVIRGGDWKHIPRAARVETRQESAPIRRSSSIGFRIIQSVQDDPQ